MTFEYFNRDDYKLKLEAKDWNDLYNAEDPSAAWSLLIFHTRRILDRYYPMKQYKNVPAKAKWISNELFEMMNQEMLCTKRLG